MGVKVIAFQTFQLKGNENVTCNIFGTIYQPRNGNYLFIPCKCTEQVKQRGLLLVDLDLKGQGE